jgi:enamine deaminase RidA (YjgF/YER057c/UK114 family)
MPARSIIPAEMEPYYESWRMSPGLEHNGVVYFTGMTGTVKGVVSNDPETQMREAFRKVGLVLEEAGLGFGDILEMTTYHVGLRDHLELFKAVRAEHVVDPYPAWTAIEVSGFATAGVIVEIRVIAKRP